ncbi:MAG: hypothetical protein IJ529_01935 [Alphaproteobacteria bacterium]|nr:hypothetical protein [Alphaproteobacteria bacterium]
MYAIDKICNGCQQIGEFIKAGKRHKIYRLPNNTRYYGLTLDQLFKYLEIL